jgi:hypothetical protein
MIEFLKRLDRTLGAIFADDDGEVDEDITEIKTIKHGGVLTTINFMEKVGDEPSNRYDVTVLLPFSMIPKNASITEMQTKIEAFANTNTELLNCRAGAQIPTADMITVIDIEPPTEIPYIVGTRRYNVN